MTDRLIVWHRWLPPRADEAAASEAAADWARAVSARFQVAGGEVLGTIGASVVGMFDVSEAADVVETCLELLDEAQEESLEIAIAVTSGPLSDEPAFGAAIELAQLLCNRARGGELVLGPRARALVSEGFLLGRQVAAGPGAPRGITVDRAHPHVLELPDAIARLQRPGLPPVAEGIVRQIGRALEAGTTRTFVLRGPVGAGTTEIVDALERDAPGGQVWHIGAAPGGLVPLASLRLSLLRRLHAPERVREILLGRGASEATVAALEHVAKGALVPRERVASALAELLELEAAAGRRPWIMLSPLSLVDGATLASLLDARERGADFVLFARLPVEPALPRPLAELGEEVLELVLPPLKTSDARAVAEAILGPKTTDDVTRPVAILGGDTIIGVVEAARTLLATGELAHDGERFVWRGAPRTGAGGGSAEELLSERLDLLDAESHRVLEALCVAPDGWSVELLGMLVARDGIVEAAFARSLERLEREALAQGTDRPRPASSLLRWRVLSRVPAARAMELHRHVGEVLKVTGTDGYPLLAELGYFLGEGGLEDEARALVAEAIEPLVRVGYERAARQLSGWLAQKSAPRDGASRATPTPPPLEALEEGPPSREIALDELLEEAESMRPPPPAPEPHAPVAVEPPAPEPPDDTLPPDATFDAVPDTVPPDAVPDTVPPDAPTPAGPERRFVQDAIRAIRDRDFPRLEELMQRAVAEGSDLGAIGRMRAVAELAKGDVVAARRSLREAEQRGRDDEEARARYLLARALLELHAGEPENGIRAGLAALAESRRRADARGENAALHALAACYRALGRDDDAARLAPG